MEPRLQAAFDELVPLIHDELHRIARPHMSSKNTDTWNPFPREKQSMPSSTALTFCRSAFDIAFGLLAIEQHRLRCDR
jgi:hypothetical protein